MLFEAPTLAEFKKENQDKEGNWLHPSNAVSYKVLERYHAGEIRHKTQAQIEAEAKKQAKEEEIKNKINEKKKWE
jgi:hypothetical protein